MRLTPSDINLLSRGLPSELDLRQIKEGKLAPVEPAEAKVAIEEPQDLVRVYNIIIGKATEILNLAKEKTKDLSIPVSEIQDQDTLEAIRHLFGPDIRTITSQMYFQLLDFADEVGTELIENELAAGDF